MQQAARRSGVKEAILVVDPSGTRWALADLLLREGFTVHSVADDAAIEPFTGVAVPSAILFGLDRDEIPALSNFLALRHSAPHATMIVLSSTADVRTKARLLELGTDDYIEEPFEPLELMARIRSFLRRQKLRV